MHLDAQGSIEYRHRWLSNRRIAVVVRSGIVAEEIDRHVEGIDFLVEGTDCMVLLSSALRLETSDRRMLTVMSILM